MTIWAMVAYALASARLTGLVAADIITEPLRARIIHRLARAELQRLTKSRTSAAGWLPPSQLVELAAIRKLSLTELIDHLRTVNYRRWATAKLITCQWCAGLWVAAAVAPAAWWLGTSPWLLVPAIAFAFSQLTGMLSNLGRD